MAFNAASWANPNQFSDISEYSGLDEKQGLTSLRDFAKQAITGAEPPPTGSSEQSFGQQVMGAIAPNIQKYGSAVKQIGQGNISGAAKTLKVPMAPGSPMAPFTPAPVSNDYDYESGIETSGLNFSPTTTPMFG